MSEYNGWANYETWNVALWFGNEEPLYNATVEGRPFTAESAEALARELMPDGTPDFKTMPASVGPYAYSQVNWQEIADAWNEE